MVVNSALDYLKGKDLSPERFSYTAWFFGPTPEEWVAQLTARKGEPLVQIAAVAEDFPEWNPNYKPQDIYRDEVAIQRLKESL